MNEQKTYEQLFQDVADLKQIVCELGRLLTIQVAKTSWVDDEGDHLDWDPFFDEVSGFQQAIANRLNPVNFCTDCQSPIKCRVIPCWNQSGVGCDCPNKPLLNISTLTAELENGDQITHLDDWSLQFIPPEWLGEKPCEEAVVGQWLPDHLG